jgi:hypothetical protein
VASEATDLRPVIHRTVWVLLERLLPQSLHVRHLATQHSEVNKECVEGILGEVLIVRRGDAAKYDVSHGRASVKLGVDRSMHDTE